MQWSDPEDSGGGQRLPSAHYMASDSTCYLWHGGGQPGGRGLSLEPSEGHQVGAWICSFFAVLTCTVHLPCTLSGCCSLRDLPACSLAVRRLSACSHPEHSHPPRALARQASLSALRSRHPLVFLGSSSRAPPRAGRRPSRTACSLPQNLHRHRRLGASRGRHSV